MGIMADGATVIDRFKGTDSDLQGFPGEQSVVGSHFIRLWRRSEIEGLRRRKGNQFLSFCGFRRVKNTGEGGKERRAYLCFAARNNTDEVILERGTFKVKIREPQLQQML